MSPLECARLGYPCTLEEVSDVAFDRMMAVGDTVADKLNAGTSMNDIVGWLEAQPDFVTAAGDPLGVRFRLEGARPFSVVTERALATWNGGGGGPASLPFPTGPRPAVVGDDPEEKRAIVLEPFLWQYVNDGIAQGQAIYQLLSGVDDQLS